MISFNPIILFIGIVRIKNFVLEVIIIKKNIYIEIALIEQIIIVI